jgi:putative transposase
VVKQVIADHSYSERRACKLIGVDRTAFQYRPRRLEDSGLRSRLRELVNERRRFGYRRLAVMLKCDGLRLNLKKVALQRGAAQRTQTRWSQARPFSKRSEI